MNRREAATVMTELASMTGAWDELIIEQWLRRLEPLEANAAMRAAETLIGSWTSTSRPPWGAYLELYGRERSRHQPALPESETGPRLSLSQHLRRLQQSTSAEAAAELERWRRFAEDGGDAFGGRWREALE